MRAGAVSTPLRPANTARVRPRGVARLFATVLAVGLVGYAYGNKGFAYLGLPPFFYDSLIFALAASFLLLRPRWMRLLADPTVFLLLLFVFWGALRTIPGIAEYGISALRDGVIWGWGAIALAVAHLVRRNLRPMALAQWYGTTMLWFVLWVPVAFVLSRMLGDSLPRWPWGPDGGVPVIVFKGGDAGVHLAGVLAFWLFVAPRLRTVALPAPLMWPGWFASFLVAATLNRGGFLALLLGSGFAAMHARLLRMVRVALVVAALTNAAILASVLDLLPRYQVNDRIIGTEQLYTNVVSIFWDVEGFSGTGTKRWRLAWWGEIIDYTVFGNYFWTGKGFGINLADDDGFQVVADGSLRSPHNGHLTILARMGVPGFVLWVLFLGSLLLRLWLRYRRLKRAGAAFEAALCLWVLAFLIAAIVNATFDVYLEGPMGGVWFWSVTGLGLSLVVRRRYPIQRFGPRVRHISRSSAACRTLPV
ncbi:MAG TPA: O-antigen ligase domain-containing protein [Rhodospirillales bacterium]|nr:O-antigen ligase domain-containing protein [Rhodospirillales bacterium]